MTKPIEALSGTDAAAFREAIAPYVAAILSDTGFSLAALDQAVDEAGDNARAAAEQVVDTVPGIMQPFLEQGIAQIALIEAIAAQIGDAAYRAKTAKLALSGDLKSNDDWQTLVGQTSGARATGAGIYAAWRAVDCPADIPAGSLIDAVTLGITLNAAVTQIGIQVYEVATTDPNVNAGPKQAADVLVADANVPLADAVPMDGTGVPLTAGTTVEREFRLQLPAGVPVRSGYTYKVLVRAYDATLTQRQIGIGSRTIANPGRQRFNGGYKTTAAAATFSNYATTVSLSIGVSQRALVASEALRDRLERAEAQLAASSQARTSEQLQVNAQRLYASAAQYGKSLPAGVTYSGDSQTKNDSTLYTIPGNRAFDVVQQFVTPTSSQNIAENGRRTDTIRSILLAQPSARYTDFGITNGGANDFNDLASGVTSVSIVGGAGGADGIYPVTVSGGTTSSLSSLPTMTATVSGGAITAVNITYRGGGYTTPPTLSVSVPGLTGHSLTANLDVEASILGNMADIRAVSAGHRIIQCPWVSIGVTPREWARSRRVTEALIAAHGAFAWDGLAHMVKFHSGGGMSLKTASLGYLPADASDAGAFTHPCDPIIGHYAREHALLLRAIPMTAFVATTTLNSTSINVTAITSGTPLAVGQSVVGPNIDIGTTITAGSGGTGTYTISKPAIKSGSVNLAVPSLGAPYIHDSGYVGIVPGAAEGTDLHTPRVLGALTQPLRIVDASKSGVAKISDAAPWRLQKGGIAPDPVTELIIEADSYTKGPTNRARVVLVEKAADNLANHAVRICGTGGSRLSIPGLSKSTSKQMTIAMLVRFTAAPKGGGAAFLGMHYGAGTERSMISQLGYRLQYNVFDATATAVGAVNGPYSDDFYGWSLYWMTVDTVAGYIRAGCNEQAFTTGSNPPTANADIAINQISELYRTFPFNDQVAPLDNVDRKFFWLSDEIIDLSQASNRALFYNPDTRMAAISAADGTIAGVTPLLYDRGKVGDMLTVGNFGKGGRIYPPPYVNAESLGFRDIAA